MFRHYAFISQKGEEFIAFDEEVSRFLIITAVIIESSVYDNNVKQLKHIQQTFTNMKQVSLEQLTDSERQIFIRELSKIDAQIYAIIVDKEKLWEVGGFGYGQLLHDYINRRLYKDLFERYNALQVYAPKENSIMETFSDYVDEQYTRDLFNPSLIVFARADDHIYFSLAHMLSELIFNVYEKEDKIHDNLFSMLAEKMLRIDVWPYVDHNSIMRQLHEFSETFDQVIAEKSIQLVQQYIEKHEDREDEDVRAQVDFLKFLLTCLSAGRDEFIYSQEIIKNMQTFSREKVNKDYMMTDIVGPLRDQGILIASTSKGYKIPTSTKDIIDYVEFSSSIILPMVRRLSHYRQIVLRLTSEKFDILKDDKFKELRAFLDLENDP